MDKIIKLMIFSVNIYLIIFLSTQPSYSQSIKNQKSIAVLNFKNSSTILNEDVELLENIYFSLIKNLKNHDSLIVYDGRYFEKQIYSNILRDLEPWQKEFRHVFRNLKIDNVINCFAFKDSNLIHMNIRITPTDSDTSKPNFEEFIIETQNPKKIAKHMKKEILKNVLIKKERSKNFYWYGLACAVEVGLLIYLYYPKNDNNDKNKLPDPPVFP